jgi:hypothetical protein
MMFSSESAMERLGGFALTDPMSDTTATTQTTLVLDGRNAHVADGVRRALGREARDFTDYVRETAATGVWNP